MRADFAGDFRSKTGLEEMAVAKARRRVVKKGEATMIGMRLWFDDSQQRCPPFYTSFPLATSPRNAAADANDTS